MDNAVYHKSASALAALSFFEYQVMFITLACTEVKALPSSLTMKDMCFC